MTRNSTGCMMSSFYLTVDHFGETITVSKGQLDVYTTQPWADVLDAVVDAEKEIAKMKNVELSTY
mgnify:CR=1 FL=1